MRIYLLKNIITGNSYVGQTRRTLRLRFNAHRYTMGKKNSCKAISDAMQKYGEDNFEISLLEECTSQQHMDECEMRWIATLNTMTPNGYNLTAGGAGKSGYRHSDESKKKMSAWQIGKKLTDAHKKKVSESLKGNKRALGMRHSAETKALISKKGLGRPSPKSPEHRKKLAAARIGRKASAETRKRMGVSHSGEKSHNAKLTEENIRAIRGDLRLQRVVAADYGINQATVSAIQLRKSWAHIL